MYVDAYLSRERTIFVCYRFSSNNYSIGIWQEKPIFTDGAQWYNNDACKWLRLQHRMYGTELKNLMERFIQHISRTGRKPEEMAQRWWRRYFSDS